MGHPIPRYGATSHRAPVSGLLRAEKVDECAARMLGVGPDRAKRLRLHLIPESITAILTACRNDAEKATNFRRSVLAAVAGTEPLNYSPTLLLDATAKSAETDLAALAASLDGMTDSERRTLIAKLKTEIAADTELLNALEAL